MAGHALRLWMPKGCRTWLKLSVQEILIPRASARTYSVKAGQWIQIIDLSGKQCSDFLAFDAQALAQGQELGLDAMATRTILGHATPAPGLHSKFFASDLQALAEVVQDTVGRHDMFLSACSNSGLSCCSVLKISRSILCCSGKSN